jgi:hypothetical protein
MEGAADSGDFDPDIQAIGGGDELLGGSGHGESSKSNATEHPPGGGESRFDIFLGVRRLH